MCEYYPNQLNGTPVEPEYNTFPEPLQAHTIWYATSMGYTAFIPAIIRVLGIDYMVEQVAEIDEGRNIAEADTAKRTIRVVMGTDEELKKEALFHELMHIVDRLSSYTADDELSEEKVHFTALLLFAIMRDNAQLRDWLFGKGYAP